LDTKRSNAINIGLTALPKPDAIKTAIMKLDNLVINREGIEVTTTLVCYLLMRSLFYEDSPHMDSGAVVCLWFIYMYVVCFLYFPASFFPCFFLIYLLPCMSTTLRIGPFCFQAGGRNGWPNLVLVFYVYFMFLENGYFCCDRFILLGRLARKSISKITSFVRSSETTLDHNSVSGSMKLQQHWKRWKNTKPQVWQGL